MTYRITEITQLLPANIIVTTDKNSPISATIRSLTGSSISRAIFYTGMMFLLISLSGCGPINRWRSRTPVSISGPIEIGNEWTEIIPPEALNVRQGTLMELRIYISNLDPSYSSPNWNAVKFKDGKITKLEGVLINDLNNEYKLYPCCNNVSYYLLSNGQLSNSGVFPVGKYIKLKLRSESPIRIEKIEWTGSYSVDNAF